jgi:UDP-N-acetylmuramoylalanine--D-glutamate ligase
MFDLTNLTSWHSDWQGKRVLVYGLGSSGFSVADSLHELGCELLVLAREIDAGYKDLLEVLGINFSTEVSEFSKLAQDFGADFAVVSPGIKPTDSLVVELAGVMPIMGDIELAWRLRDKVKMQDWILITGTNGKTTTTQLVEQILLSDSKRAIACGNIGNPVLDAVRDPIGFDYLVVEVSSFQLHYMSSVMPKVSALLNIAEDHIDWHGSFESYKAAKGKVFTNTTGSIIYNAEDVETRKLAELADVNDESVLAVSFTRLMPGDLQVGYVEEFLVDRAFYGYRANELPELTNLDEIAQIGVVTPHLLANVAAAAAITRACDVSAEAIRSAIQQFKLDKHRIEFVAERNGTLWFDDSKATNAHAADASLSSFESVVWIVGGLLKGVDLKPLIENHANRLKCAIVIGELRSDVVLKLQTFAPSCQVIEIESNEQVMRSAVAAANKVAEPGDVVLLAPAAASMDQFRDYADRGNRFAEAVRELE